MDYIGYTHYFYTYKEPNAKKWQSFTDDVKKVLANLPKHSTSSGACYEDPLVVNGNEDGTEPVVNEDIVCFNGEGELGHETFYLSRVPEGEFAFCKTARKPYDFAVQACLVLYQHHFGKDVQVSSDGGAEDWQEVASFIHRLFDIKVSFSEKEPFIRTSKMKMVDSLKMTDHLEKKRTEVI